MWLDKANTILKICILIALVGLLVELRVYRLDSCELCSFKANSTTVTVNDFMNYYNYKCLIVENKPMNWTGLNFNQS